MPPAVSRRPRLVVLEENAEERARVALAFGLWLAGWLAGCPEWFIQFTPLCALECREGKDQGGVFIRQGFRRDARNGPMDFPQKQASPQGRDDRWRTRGADWTCGLR